MSLLYELPRRARFTLLDNTEVPVGGLPVNKEEIYTLSHIDGMYSYCKDSQGRICHIKAYAKVKEVDHQPDSK
jgi:hypothetical protein